MNKFFKDSLKTLGFLVAVLTVAFIFAPNLRALPFGIADQFPGQQSSSGYGPNASVRGRFLDVSANPALSTNTWVYISSVVFGSAASYSTSTTFTASFSTIASPTPADRNYGIAGEFKVRNGTASFRINGGTPMYLDGTGTNVIDKTVINFENYLVRGCTITVQGLSQGATFFFEVGAANKN